MDISKTRRKATSLIVLVATTLLVSGAVFAVDKLEPKVVTSQQEKRQPTVAFKKGEVSANGFKNGNYSAVGPYQSPGGSQEIKINITLVDGAVAESSAEGDSKSSSSKFYQKSFIANYKKEIVGKKIDEIKFDHVGNSSLTTNGFNNALEQIKNQAKD